MFDYWGLATLQPFGEATAVENLRRQDFDAYAPKFLELRVIRGRKVETASSLFQGYLFVRLTDRWRSIFGTRGVSGMIMDGDANAETAVPSRVRDREIEKLRAAEVDGVIILEPRVRARRKFAAGDQVMVRAGTAMEYKLGIFSGDARHDRMKVLFRMLGRETPVYVRESDLVAV
jgi:transcriptional antiterminator RfaH